MSETVKQKVYAALSRDEWKPLLKVFKSLEVSEDLPRAEIALGLEALARKPATADFTVDEYVALARRRWERGNRAPWYRPFDVFAEIEIEVPA